MLDAREHPDVVHGFGVAGAGMQAAVEVDPDWVIEETERSESEDEAVYDLSTMISADEAPIDGKELLQIFDEVKRTGKTFASVARARLADRCCPDICLSGRLHSTHRHPYSEQTSMMAHWLPPMRD
jgi:hypothetical protein